MSNLLAPSGSTMANVQSQPFVAQGANSPDRLVDEVADRLFLVTNDVNNGVALVAKALEQVSVLLTLDDSSSASDHDPPRVFGQELLENDRLGVAKCSPTMICSAKQVVSERISRPSGSLAHLSRRRRLGHAGSETLRLHR